MLSRPALLFSLGFAVVTVAAMLLARDQPGPQGFDERTIAAQAGRSSPFSIWGTGRIARADPGAILAATGVLAIALAFVPRKKSLLQVAAFSAALLIGGAVRPSTTGSTSTSSGSSR